MPDEPIIDSPAGDSMPSPHDARGQVSREERHHAMGHLLKGAIEEGKHQVPAEPNPLVSRPSQLESWRVFKIMSEFVEGFDLLRRYTLAATFFGSARESFDSTIYQAATELASRLAKAGFAIITGGSSGVMQAANRGAYEAGGASVGLNIRLEDNQATNKYVTDGMTFDHFFIRKVMLTFASEVYIYFPGGFGTMDEFFEIATLVQTKKIRHVPIVLFGKEYWTPIVTLFKEKFYEEYHAIDEGDLELYHLVDTIDEAYDYIIQNVQKR
ncbi:TIGR00730 family Rossman fold protein [Patescibacteria group bacterium]|nr:TIGR00730 family Rossman fold protein [Patescibacteria group bacterium]